MDKVFIVIKEVRHKFTDILAVCETFDLALEETEKYVKIDPTIWKKLDHVDKREFYDCVSYKIYTSKDEDSTIAIEERTVIKNERS